MNEPNEQPQKKKKRNPVLRVLAFLLSLVVVLCAVALVAFRDQLNLDAVKRFFTYHSLSVSDSGQAASFPYDGEPEDLFADLNGNLLVCSGNTVSLYSGSGTRYVSQSVSLVQPALNSCGGRAVVYDAGGTSLYVYDEKEQVFTLDGNTDDILSARLNSDGWLTVVTHASGYRGVATVYDPSGAPKMAVQLSSAFIMDAVLENDNNTLAVVTITQQDGSFTSVLSTYRMDKTDAGSSGEVQPQSTQTLGSNVVLDMAAGSGCLFALGDYGVSVVKTDGTLADASDWSDRYLKNYSLTGDNFSVALVGKYRAGTQAQLVVTDSDGKASAMDISEQVLSLSAAGKYFAVLTADRLDIYSTDLTLYASLDGTHGARRVLLRSDGTAVLIAADSARLFIPS